MIDHAGRSVRTRTNVIISAAGVALIVAGLGLAGSWLWVIYELAVAGRAWSLDASEWLHGGRFSSFLFFRTIRSTCSFRRRARGNSGRSGVRLMKKITRLSILLLLASARLPAQALAADSLFDRLIGHWVLRGTIARQSTTHDVTFDWMLGRENVQMDGQHRGQRVRPAGYWPGKGGWRLGSLRVPLHANNRFPYHLRVQSCDGLLAVAHGQ